MLKDEVSGLLQKKMDRLDFLKHVGAGLVVMTGVGTIVKTMGGLGTPKQGTGYGASIYGGSKSLNR